MNNIKNSIVDTNYDLLTLDLDLLDLIVGGDGNGAAPFPPMPTEAPPAHSPGSIALCAGDSQE